MLQDSDRERARDQAQTGSVSETHGARGKNGRSEYTGPGKKGSQNAGNSNYAKLDQRAPGAELLKHRLIDVDEVLNNRL